MSIGFGSPRMGVKPLMTFHSPWNICPEGCCLVGWACDQFRQGCFLGTDYPKGLTEENQRFGISKVKAWVMWIISLISLNCYWKALANRSACVASLATASNFLSNTQCLLKFNSQYSSSHTFKKGALPNFPGSFLSHVCGIFIEQFRNTSMQKIPTSNNLSSHTASSCSAEWNMHWLKLMYKKAV